MKKRIMRLFLVFMFAKIMAGDVAVFVNEGFTIDGKYYLFGQYGQTDVGFQGYAGIYVVDVEKNEYKDRGIFRTYPSKKTKNIPGKTVYEALKTKINYELKQYDRKTTPTDDVFYIRVNSKDSKDEEIKLRPLGKNSTDKQTYVIKLKSKIEKDENLSSFYVEFEKHDEDGNLIASQKIGHEEVKRPNIADYIIDRVILDKQNETVVIVIEKREKDKNDINIRYMVESAKLDKKFF